MDVARLLPAAGALLFLIPLLWPVAEGPGQTDAMPLSSAMTYVLAIWALLILMAFLFGLAVRRWADHWTSDALQNDATGHDQDVVGPMQPVFQPTQRPDPASETPQ
ncbi:hypothetical protein [Phaeobacter sp.]|uniref:hypothetical protein n=1 Tax=Phaeobacter sp. TaxID=1902409 RepID=UPI0025E44A39|nr:hypothetical protein [Phaeobacter sp.]